MKKLKKSISIILAAVMMLSVFIIAPMTASASENILSPETGKVYLPGSEIPLKIVTDAYKENTDNYCQISVYEYVDVRGGRYAKVGSSIFVKYSKKGETINNPITINKYGIFRVCVSFYYTVNGYANYFGDYKVRTLDTNDNWISYSEAITVVIDKLDNPMTVKTATKTVKASALKKAKKTVKPLTIKKAKGAVTVTKEKSGTTSSIYKKITVNKNSGAVTFKKGTYKKGTYKVKLKITAAGNDDYKENTITKTVKIKIK